MRRCSLANAVVDTVKSCKALFTHGSSQNHFTYLLGIYAEKKSLSNGKALHAHIFKCVCDPDVVLFNSLANMYSKCLCMEDARKVFDEITQPDVVSWNTMISGYVLSGLKEHAFTCLRRMISSSAFPDQFTLTGVLKGCIDIADFGVGLQVHSVSTKLGLGDNVVVGSGLLEFYANFTSLDEVMKVFDGLKWRDIVLVNCMIGALAKGGLFAEGLEIFRWIFYTSLKPTRATFVNLLNLIDSSHDLKQGMQIHGLIIKFGFGNDGSVENSLVRVYASCDLMDDAFSILFHSGSDNVRSWTTLVNGYSTNGRFEDAMDVFGLIYNESILMDHILLAYMAAVSAASECLHLGAQIHSVSLRMGFVSDPHVNDSLMDMYAKCLFMEDALKLFLEAKDYNNLYSWTIVVSGYVHNGFPEEALQNFKYMRYQCIDPDSVTCIHALVACTDLKSIEQGEQLHAYVIKFGCETDVSVQTALLSLYIECESLHNVAQLFGHMNCRDVISWTTLITGYTKLGHFEEALTSFIKMLQDAIQPNHFTLASTLAACAKLTATEMGESLHSHIIKCGLSDEKFDGSALVDLYSKCGKIESAVKCFEAMPKSDAVPWNALLAGYAYYGCSLEVFKTFDELQNYGVEPDEITFLAVLSGCSHGGFVEKALHYFILMQEKYQLLPTAEHYSCIVGAFGRAGRFKEAVEFIKGMRFEPGIVVLRTLLSSCVVHGSIRLGLAVAGKIIQLDQCDSATYVLLSNLFSLCGRWTDSKKVRELMDTTCLERKKVGRSWIE